MRSPEQLPSHLARAPFTVEQARRARISRKRTRFRDLSIPSRGLRRPLSAPYDLLSMCRALTSVTPNGVISHVTAARIHGLYLPARLETQTTLDVSRRIGEALPRRRGVHGRRLALGPHDVGMFGGVPVTSVQRTLLDLAALLSVNELVVVADQIVCEHHGRCVPPKFPMVALGELKSYIDRHAGARGMGRLRAAMEMVRIGSDSAQETWLRLIITKSSLPNFEPGLEIKNAAGEPLVEPDLACEKYRTCAEYDGAHHFTSEQQSRDHDRNFLTASLGWHQVLINKDDMRAGSEVAIAKIARMLVRGGWDDPQNLAGGSLLGTQRKRRGFA